MHLGFLDWLIIILFFAISLAIGLYYKNKAGKNISEFFLGGRNLPWYIAGISMVATTFAADTPLLVTEIVSKNGISSNWLWWNMLIGGMLTTFFFARLWRRSEVLTELEFIELRYEGKAAAFLRGFKAIYLGVFLNAMVIGWVNFALMKILQVFFEIPEADLLWYAAGAMLITSAYAAMSGLWGVAVTDVVQFTIAMTGCIILAYIVLDQPQIGGIEGLKAKLPPESLNFFPSLGSSSEITSSGFQKLGISFLAFFSFIGVQWWASWYPGAEPGGGGYVAQRMMSAKNEKHSVYATLFFQIAHYCLRPWPWIIVALCSIVLYPDLSPNDKSLGYVMAMKDFLPTGLKGLLLVAFLAAYMSTISTQLNWGASFITNDIYRRFIKSEKDFNSEEEAQKHLVKIARIGTILIMLFSLFVTSRLSTIEQAWKFILGCGAGLGMVLILRWYWWRINAWSEFTATIAPFIAYGISVFILEPTLGEAFTSNNGSFFVTVIFTSICWPLVTFLTKTPISENLKSFYLKVKPAGNWTPVEKELGLSKPKSSIGNLLICWGTSVIMTYSILFLIGKIIFKEWNEAIVWFIVFIISFYVLRKFVVKTNIFDE